MRENRGGAGVKATVGEVLPCAAMVVVEGCVIGLTIMTSIAMTNGMSPFVFVVFTNVLGSIILIPISFFYHRAADRSEGPLLSMAFLVRVFLLGLIGVSIAQNLAFVGLSYSSPIVACGMANQLPAFTFVLGIILRTTRFDWKSGGSRARLIGTFISFAGAILLTLYKGPAIRNHSSPLLALRAVPPRLLVFISTRENWVLGCVLFAASSLTLAIWNIVQVGTEKICPQIMKVVSFYSLFGAIQSCALAVFLERDPVAWRLDLNFELFIIVVTAIFSTLVRTSVQIWCTRSKGPHFVPAFKPIGIAYASTLGCFFFSDKFHYGSMVGAFVCGVGYYTVLWGQIKDEDHGTQKLDDQKVPLLQEESQV